VDANGFCYHAGATQTWCSQHPSDARCVDGWSSRGVPPLGASVGPPSSWLVVGTPQFAVDWMSKQPGDILFHFNPRISTIVMNTFDAGSWGVEEIIPLDSQAEGQWTVRVDDDGFHLLAGEGKKQGACGDGFFQQHGDVPGWGKIGDSGGGQGVADCSECGELCASTSGCLSYECSPRELKCNLNTRNSPKAESSDYRDYTFCSKHELHVFAHRLPWASFSHVEKSGECVVTEEPGATQTAVAPLGTAVESSWKPVANFALRGGAAWTGEVMSCSCMKNCGCTVRGRDNKCFCSDEAEVATGAGPWKPERISRVRKDGQCFCKCAAGVPMAAASQI